MDPDTILAWATVVSVLLSTLLGLIVLIQKIRAGKLKEAQKQGEIMGDELMKLIEALKVASTGDSKDLMKRFAEEMHKRGLESKIDERLKELGLNEPR